MDIHRPKVAHSLREFLAEIGTVTCGILIALGLEQAIEAVHHRTVVAEARKSIRGELVANGWRMRKMDDYHQCTAEKLTAIERVLADDAPSGRNPGHINVGRPWQYTWDNSRWTATNSAGIGALFPREEFEVYGRLYDYIGQLEKSGTAEQDAWANLQSLRHPTPLGVQDRLFYYREVDKIRQAETQAHNLIRYAETVYAPLKLDFSAGPERYAVNSRSPTVCAPLAEGGPAAAGQ